MFCMSLSLGRVWRCLLCDIVLGCGATKWMDRTFVGLQVNLLSLRYSRCSRWHEASFRCHARNWIKIVLYYFGCSRCPLLVPGVAFGLGCVRLGLLCALAYLELASNIFSTADLHLCPTCTMSKTLSSNNRIMHRTSEVVAKAFIWFETLSSFTA